jgi:hypothetical protein
VSESPLALRQAALLERARMGARAISTERPAPIQHKTYAAARRLVVGPAVIGEVKEMATLKRGFDGLRTPGEA